MTVWNSGRGRLSKEQFEIVPPSLEPGRRRRDGAGDSSKGDLVAFPPRRDSRRRRTVQSSDGVLLRVWKGFRQAARIAAPSETGSDNNRCIAASSTSALTGFSTTAPTPCPR